MLLPNIQLICVQILVKAGLDGRILLKRDAHPHSILYMLTMYRKNYAGIFALATMYNSPTIQSYPAELQILSAMIEA